MFFLQVNVNQYLFYLKELKLTNKILNKIILLFPNASQAFLYKSNASPTYINSLVSILLIFPLPNHLSQIFFRDIPNDAKKSLRPLGHMRPVGSVPQVKIDRPWNQKIYV